MSEFIKNRLFILWPFGIGLFAVMFLWGFWQSGVTALGFNATILIISILFFLLGYKNSGEKWGINIFKKTRLFWLIPYILIALSFSIYENPWLKLISLLVLIIILAIFINYDSLIDKKIKWNWHFVDSVLTSRILSFLNSTIFRKANDTLMNAIRLNDASGSKKIIKKVILGTFLFIIIAFIILPLLASADPIFADKIRDVVSYILNYVSWDVIWRIFVAFVVGFLLTTIFLAWKKPQLVEEKLATWSPDAIVGGIVLTGTLIIYLLFIGVQIDNLWVKSLPIVFDETASLVKSGFWQLFTLSVINVILYFIFYKKDHNIIQIILTVFTFSSLLLVISASQRMFLYIKYYGLSYEKFFASYTVLYSIILFVCLIIFLLCKKKADIFKFLVIFFIWMYSIATILPIESIIFKTNIKLSAMPKSRIELNELTMLSSDVLNTAENYSIKGQEEEWKRWIAYERNQISYKSWYEKNISNLINSR